MSSFLTIRAFESGDQEAVVALWIESGITRPWNNPYKDIQRKLAEQPELFLVAEQAGVLVATAMVGYEGHRGWIYYFAVSPSVQGQGIGQALMHAAEDLLIARGCPKVCLMVRTSNTGVMEFYKKLGYTADDVIPMAKRLIAD